MAYPFYWLFSTISLASGTIVDQFSSSHRLTGSSFGISGRNATFDYVVIGAGIAGSVVATRLAEKNLSVALVEAGSFYELTNGNLSQVPFFSDEGIGGDVDDWQPQVDWGFITTPQVNGKRYHYVQGKTLGGSSARNSMLYHWPTKGAYEAWAEQVGDGSYRWENMKQYLERSVQFTTNTRREGDNQAMHTGSSGSGPLQVSSPAYVNPLSAYGYEAFSSLGLKSRFSLTNGTLEGVGWWQFTIDSNTGLRSSAESSFLSRELSRKGSRLTIYTGSLARRILFDRNTAVGVEVTSIDGKRPFSLKARREVVLSAGVWNSPHLLMVSGVGDKSVLEPLGIPVISHRPGVGQNVRDSCYLSGPVYEVSVPGPSHWQQLDRLADAEAEFLVNATGPLTNIGLDLAVFDMLPTEGRASLSKETKKLIETLPKDWPLIEYSLSSTNRIGQPNDPEKHYGTVDCVLVATVSRGNMTINSTSNLDPPIINPNWLREKPDQEIALKAYRQARKVWSAIPSSLRVGEELYPGSKVTTDEELLASIKQALDPIHHASSSCAMGKRDDPDAATDSRARVYGVENLRVVDASSFAFTPAGHIQGATYAHAEKLADDILEDYESISMTEFPDRARKIADGDDATFHADLRRA